jgi:hypothetical protein
LGKLSAALVRFASLEIRELNFGRIIKTITPVERVRLLYASQVFDCIINGCVSFLRCDETFGEGEVVGIVGQCLLLKLIQIINSLAWVHPDQVDVVLGLALVFGCIVK